MVVKKVENPDKSASKKTRIRRLARYILAPETENEKEKCIQVVSRGFLSTDHEVQIAEMVALAQDAVRSTDPILHFVISWKNHERPTRIQVVEAVDIATTELCVPQHQVLAALHADTQNIHLHVMLNRVDPATTKVTKINAGFDLEALHRAVARIEHVQGWESEKGARYRVTDDGKLERTPKPNGPQRATPTQRQLDQERRTGEKSAARSAIETAGPIINRASSWEQLHRLLAHKGMRYARSGSGATIQVGDVRVKASTASREATLKRVEARLGSYRTAAECGLKENKTGTEAEDNPTEFRVRLENPTEALPFIETATSWEQLHDDLGKRGMRYAKTGSGATIFAGRNYEFSMKASAVSRTITLRKLEERLGPFVPAPSDREPPPQDMPRWHEYADAEERHRAEMRLAWEAYEKERQEEEEQLHQEHRAARAELLREQSRKQRGKELRLRQSLLALEQAQERVAMIDSLRRRREALRAKYSPWPDFGEWVDDHEVAFLWRARFTAVFSIEVASPTGRNFETRAKGDIRDYQARQVGDWVLYTTAAHRRERKVAFVDRGKRITVHDWPNPSSILAALQLATQKWDRIVVKGNSAFKMECARLAAQHGFTVANPELQEVIRKIRTERERRVRSLQHELGRNAPLKDGPIDSGSVARSRPTNPKGPSRPSL